MSGIYWENGFVTMDSQSRKELSRPLRTSKVLMEAVTVRSHKKKDRRDHETSWQCHNTPLMRPIATLNHRKSQTFFALPATPF